MNKTNILTGLSIGGVLLSTVLSIDIGIRRTKKPSEKIKIEDIKGAMIDYIPVLVVAAATIGCIIKLDRTHTAYRAELVTAYLLLKDQYDKKKAQIGSRTPKEIEEMNDEILVYDMMSQSYFKSTPYQMLYAFYKLNEKIDSDAQASLSYFYDLLNWEFHDTYSEESHYVGWRRCPYDNKSWVTFQLTKSEMDDGLECFILSCDEKPELLVFDEIYK